MTAKLTIAFSDDLLRIMKSNQALKLTLGSRRGGGPAPKAAGSRAGRRPGGAGRRTSGFRPGTLPARLVEWANSAKRAFTTDDVSRKFKLTRAHASMLLSKLSTIDKAIRREARGLYNSK